MNENLKLKKEYKEILEEEEDIRHINMLETNNDNPFFKIVNKSQISNKKKHLRIKSVEVQQNENSIFYQLRKEIRFSKIEILASIKKTKERNIQQMLKSK